MVDLEGHLSHAKAARLRRRGRKKREATEQAGLYRLVLTRWWAPWYRHVEQANMIPKVGEDLRNRGKQAGQPDVFLRIPPISGQRDSGRIWGDWDRVLAALELKAPYQRPKRKLEPDDTWWLYYKPEIDPLAKHEPSHYGLRASQARELQILHACGYQTMVAYSAEEAFEWLDKVAGPKPEILPEI